MFFVMYQWHQLSKDLWIVLYFVNDMSEKSELRIVTGKKQRQRKLQRSQKVQNGQMGIRIVGASNQVYIRGP